MKYIITIITTVLEAAFLHVRFRIADASIWHNWIKRM